MYLCKQIWSEHTISCMSTKWQEICYSLSCIFESSQNSLCVVGKSRGTVPSPSQTTGPVWIIQTWQSCVVAGSSNRNLTAASLISWGGRDQSWETCPRWELHCKQLFDGSMFSIGVRDWLHVSLVIYSVGCFILYAIRQPNRLRLRENVVIDVSGCWCHTPTASRSSVAAVTCGKCWGQQCSLFISWKETEKKNAQLMSDKEGRTPT